MLSDLPQGYYKAIVADPPWLFKSYTALQMQNWNSRRDVEKHYPVMTIDDLCALPVQSLAAREGCHLFLWITGPNLPAGLRVMQAWGFKYSSVAFCWVKLKRRHNQLTFLPVADDALHVGLGLTTRHNIELCLLGRRGNARRIAKDVREVILSPVREHSRKPDEVYTRVERYCAGPRLDLFSREDRPGWDSWGWEKGKFNHGRLPDEPAAETSAAERGDQLPGEEDRPRAHQELQQEVPGNPD